VTTTLPVVAPVGTTAVILVALQFVIVAVVPLNCTLPLPCEAPKFDPAITTDEPTAPEFGVMLLILGAGVTVKLNPLLAIPPAAVTTTFPVIAPAGTVAVMVEALQFVTVAVVPANITLPLP
jgi:predicted Kef-type K+ transport protein